MAVVRPHKARPARGGGPGPHARLDVQFHDTVDPQRHAFFSRHLQRRPEGDRDVVVLQDVKDVALFQALAPLPADFVDLFHAPQVDRFLRTLVIYFQCYLHAHNEMNRRLKVLKEKLRSLRSHAHEDRLGTCLSELRALVGRDYGALLVGQGATARHHHMANRLHASDIETDLRLYELLYRVCARVVWIALGRQNLSLIELEVDRLFRTRAFSNAERCPETCQKFLQRNPDYSRVLLGSGAKTKSKLLAKSPAIEDFMHGAHSCQIFTFSGKNVEKDSQKMKLLLAAQFSAEEQLSSLGIPVGILGRPRKDFDAMLVPTDPLYDESIKMFSAMRGMYVHPGDLQCVHFGASVPHDTLPAAAGESSFEQSQHADGRREAAKTLWKSYMRKRMRR